MNKRIVRNRDERATIGISTLIVFIAMVLVAAIAAAVLINAAGKLENQASSVTDSASTFTKFTVVKTMGYMDPNVPNRKIDSLMVLVKLYPGSDDINISRDLAISIDFQSPGEEAKTYTLTMHPNLADDPSFYSWADGTGGYNTTYDVNTGMSYFNATPLVDPYKNWHNNFVLDGYSLLELNISTGRDPSAAYDPTYNPEFKMELPEDTSGTLNFICTGSVHPTVIRFTTPHEYRQEGGWVEI